MRIRKVGVVGAGAMGGGIAALAASAGVPVVLLDVPGEDDRAGPARGGGEGPQVEARRLRGSPAGAADRDRQHQDDLQRLAQCDRVVEAIIEQPEPKRALYRRLEEVLSGHAVVTTNTSGIPMRVLTEGRNESFRRRFLGTHFFNPVRYMHLLEVIPAPEADPEVLRSLEE